MDYTGPWSGEYLEDQYRRWKEDPQQISRDWQHFFTGFELGFSRQPENEGVCDVVMVRKQSCVEALVYAYRDIGHLLACLDPLEACPTQHPLLEPGRFGLKTEDYNESFYFPGVADEVPMPLKQILQHLKQTYCRSIGVEYMHLQDPDEREWLRERMESSRNIPELTDEEKIRIVNKLFQAKRFEQFLHRKYLGQKRFSLEGAEVIIPLLDFLIQQAGNRHDCKEVFLGMAHRGRLNVLVNVLGKRYEDIFREFENTVNLDGVVGTGDVKYHKGHSTSIPLQNGGSACVVLADNPSHLEAVNPVVEGMARARLDSLKTGRFSQVMPVLIHGDAAFAGQGIVTETLNMSQLDGYCTGGTVHIVINNQIGYTTLPEDARSTRYSTDNAKGIMVPIFHVHGSNPEAVIHTIRLACDYRMTFNKDVVIDVVCYRQYGHNEGDEPYFTQPLMYERIRSRPSLDRQYADELVEKGLLDKDRVAAMEAGINQCQEEALEKAKVMAEASLETDVADDSSPDSEAAVAGIDKEALVDLAKRLNTVPADFHPHPKIGKLLEKRIQAVAQDKGVDWGNAEILAYGTILQEKIPIRLSGEDSQRGTFSHRHSVLFDPRNNEAFCSLAATAPDEAPFTAINSLLSEAGVLGFEYGYSVARPECLTIWEAQFGDFANNAQVIIDQFLVSGETKWQTQSGLVLLLPHGYEGMGPEHSSARLERFLQLCAQGNIQVANPTTPANFFHLLRRQAIGRVAKPLVVMSPKSLLRHPLAVSRVDDICNGGFQTVLDDPAPVKKPKTVLLVSGKLFYELFRARQALEASWTALIRIEQYYPFPIQAVEDILSRYKGYRKVAWVQEEPQNMGAWRFMQERMRQHLGIELQYIGREASASPATGFHAVFKQEQNQIVQDALTY